MTLSGLFRKAGGDDAATVRRKRSTDYRWARRQPLIGLLLLAVVTVAGIGIATYVSVRQSITDRAGETLTAIAMLKVGQIEHWLAERRDDTRFMTESPAFSADLEQWLRGGMRDAELKASLSRRLNEMAAIPQHRTICIHSATDGSVLLSAGQGHPDNPRDRMQALKAAALPLFDDLHFNGDGAGAEIDLGFFSPIGSGDAAAPPLAVAHLAADPTKLLFPLLQQWPGSSPSAETLLVRIEGKDLVFLNDLRHRPDSALRFRMPLSATDYLAALAAPGATGTVRGLDYRNVASLARALPVAGTPWWLIAKVDEDEVYAQLNKMALFSAIVTALALLVTLWWIVEHARSTQNIERLSRLYAAISKTNQAIIHSQSPQEVYRAVCDACAELAGLRLVWVGIADSASRRIEPVAAAGDATDYLAGIAISTDAALPEGRGPTGSAFREQRVCECVDYLADPDVLPWRQRAVEHGLACSISLPLTRANSSVGVLCVYGSERNFFDGEALKILGEMASNISFFLDHFDQECERKRLAAEMSKHVAEIEDLYQNAPCGYHSLDADGLIVRINDTELRWLGYAREEVVNRLRADDLLTEASRTVFGRHFDEFKASGHVRSLELEMVRKDGSLLPVTVTASVVLDSEGNYLYSRSTVFDMTELKGLQAERAEHENRLRALSRRLVAVQEEERRQLVNELHDSASPNLAAIQVILNAMKIALATGQPRADIETSLEDALALLEDTGLNIREICSELRPPLLDYSGLVPALDGYAHQFSRRTGTAVHFNARGAAAGLTSEIESALFRIAQEALTNCAKHAGASSIDIELAITGQELKLVVADNGVGFSPQTLGEPDCVPGLGLLTMRERAEFIGGVFAVASQPGNGTRITVTVAVAPTVADTDAATARPDDRQARALH